MKPFLIILAILQFSICCNSQNNSDESIQLDMPIRSADILNEGVYYSLSDLRENSPDDSLEYIIKKRNDFVQMFFGAKPAVLKYYDISKAKYKRYSDPNWGVCIDEHIYLNYKGAYFQLKELEKYTYFTRNGYAWRSNSSGLSFPYYYEVEYVVNTISNDTYSLTKSNIIKILEYEDAQLLEDFKQEKLKVLMVGNNEEINMTIFKKYIDSVNRKYY